jgi:hypothetical protein
VSSHFVPHLVRDWYPSSGVSSWDWVSIVTLQMIDWVWQMVLENTSVPSPNGSGSDSKWK